MDLGKWTDVFTQAGIAPESAATYAKNFVDENLSQENLAMLDRALLTELGVKTLGDALTIMRLGKSVKVPESSYTVAKAPMAKPPSLSAEMTQQQFRKFIIDWNVYVEMTNLSKAQFHAQLYSCANESVQNAIINTHPDFFKKQPDELLDLLENIVTKKSNPVVHRMAFAGLSRGQAEAIQNFTIRLKSAAQDCDFSCPSCKHNLSEVYIKDQMIRGLANETLQTDILAKAESLTTLDSIIKHAEAFESALRDQAKMCDVSDVAVARLSSYAKQKRAQPARLPRVNTYTQLQPTASSSGPRFNRGACAGCGSARHGMPGANDRASKCPAWGKACATCHRMHHFARVCRSSGTSPGSAAVQAIDSMQYVDGDIAPMDALIAHVTFDQESDTYTTATGADINEIDATLIPFSPSPESRSPHDIPPPSETVLPVFPDSGATICLGGPQHLRAMGLSQNNLIPSQKVVRTVGNYTLVCQGWIPVKFVVGEKFTKQALYICNKIDRIYFSRSACVDVGILSPQFPHLVSDSVPVPCEVQSAVPSVQASVGTDPGQTGACKGPADCGICKPVPDKGGYEGLGIGPGDIPWPIRFRKRRFLKVMRPDPSTRTLYWRSARASTILPVRSHLLLRGFCKATRSPSCNGDNGCAVWL